MSHLLGTGRSKDQQSARGSTSSSRADARVSRTHQTDRTAIAGIMTLAVGRSDCQPQMTPDAADRSKRLLAALLREYIASGEPIASSLLVTAAGLGLSSATVRSILARLEEDGYLQQPHTSAGRIPTDRGYRFYVDLLLDSKRPRRATISVEARLRRENPDRLLDSLLPQVSHMLSQASRNVGFAIRPAHEAAVFDRVEFVPLSVARVLVVIVASGGHVIQKVIDVGEPLDADDLRAAANYLNAEFSGLPLHRAREAVLQRMNEERLPGDAPRELDVFRSARRSADSCRGCLCAPRRCDRPDDADAAGPAADDRREAEAPPTAERIHRRPGADGRHRGRAPRSRPAALQPGPVDLRRRLRHRDRRRDWTDPHALLASHRRRRRCGAGGVTHVARSELKLARVPLWLMNP